MIVKLRPVINPGLYLHDLQRSIRILVAQPLKNEIEVSYSSQYFELMSTKIQTICFFRESQTYKSIESERRVTDPSGTE